MPLAPGTPLGPYEVVDLLGAGGMGEVYRARDSRLGRQVAVKVLLDPAIADSERLQRFEREARATAALSHPNVVTLFDVGFHEGRPFLVAELLEGETLRRRLAGGPLPPAEAVRLALQLTRGVAAAHALRVVHRDLKPENLFLTRGGTLKVLDFGLAKLKSVLPEGDGTTLALSSAGQILGTLAYMAPEQLRGEPVDERADLFAIGVVLLEMVSGKSPFLRGSGAETIAAILHGAPAMGATSGAQPPQALRRVVLRCLEKHPAARFQSASDLVFALEGLGEELTRPPPSASPGELASSIAVLPFADLSPARDQDYLCEGIAEELINALGHVEGLRVAARGSSFQFRGPAIDVRAVGERLGVGTVLEGSVRKSGDRLRINVQLVDVADGYHRWSERFDRGLEDVFAIEDEIAASVATTLRGVLSAREREALRRPETEVETYELFLRGRQLVHRFDRNALVGAQRMFERALEIDPAYAPAWAGLAEVHGWFYDWWGGGPEDLEAADRASQRALELGPDLGETHAARGFVLSIVRDYEGADRAYRAALDKNPGSFDALYYYARTCFAWGQVERSVELFRRAAEARREDFQSPILLGQSLHKLGREEESREANLEGVRRAERRLELDPHDARALSLGANALCDAGQVERGLEWSRRAIELYPDDQSVLVNGACLRAKSGLKDEALELLGRTFARGFGKRDWIANDPDYDSLRDDPRFQALLEKLR